MSDRSPNPPALPAPVPREVAALQTICLALILGIAAVALRIAVTW